MISRLIQAICIIVGCVLCQATSQENDLRTKLMNDYNPDTHPAPKTDVTFSISVLHHDMNEELKTLDLDIWMKLIWDDPRLKWSNSTYPGINYLSFKQKSLWKPDVMLYNSAIPGNQELYTPHQLLVKYDGSVIWVPPMHIKASCVMDMLYWPYDTHNCTLRFGSWVHSSLVLDMQIKKNIVTFEALDQNVKDRNLTRSEWTVISTETVRVETMYACCPDSYVNIKVTFVVQRNAPAYCWMVQAPVVVLSLLTLVVFILPPSSGERLFIGGILLILDLGLLCGLNKMIGHSANHTPLIVKFISKQLIIVAVSVFLSAIILRLIRDKRPVKLPSILRQPLLTLSSCLRLDGHKHMMTTSLVSPGPSMKNASEDLELNEGSGNRLLVNPEEKAGGQGGDLMILAEVMDRFCLLAFIVVILVHIVCYSIVL